MRSFVVVVTTPVVDDPTSIGEICEPVLVQAAVAECAIETLDEGILRWLPRLDEVQLGNHYADSRKTSPCS
jgi:hypothetical protein